VPSARDPRSPCLIGVARRTWHPEECGPDGAPEPLDMWADMARAAAEDSGGRDVLARLDRVDVVYCQSWQYDDPAERLAAAVGASPRIGAYSGIGGTVPQVLVSRLAREVLAGRLDLGLVVGAEALATRRRLKKAGAKPAWRFPPSEKRPFPFDLPVHPGEVAHHIFEAWLTFAMFDNAHRAHLGTGLEQYRRELGELLSPMTAVAAANPHAWFPVARGVEEILGPTPDNRMVGYPYSKLMTAIMDVDMAAALLVASDETADALGVPVDRRVYLRGWGYAEDPVALGARADLWRSGAMAAAATAALAGAGVTVDAVDHMDLYSCFTSSVAFAIDALGLDPARSRRRGPETPDRPVTVTGGLPYHGGPGSNYMTHSLATMADRLRADPGAVGLVSGVGMHMNKHTFAAYSTEPGPVVPPDDEDMAAAARMDELPVLESYEGGAAVATYSVVHGRDGDPESAALVCDIPAEDGRATAARCYARLSDPDALAEAERTELIGRPVTLEGAAGHTEAHL
jgi:acetyl-CoA C-acetyltransferase